MYQVHMCMSCLTLLDTTWQKVQNQRSGTGCQPKYVGVTLIVHAALAASVCERQNRADKRPQRRPAYHLEAYGLLVTNTCSQSRKADAHSLFFDEKGSGLLAGHD